MSTDQQSANWHCPDWKLRVLVTAILGGLVILLFRGLLAGCVARWSSEPQYSHGFVIPLIAAGLGWHRRTKIVAGDARCCSAGLSLLFAGVVCHLISTYLYIEAIDAAGFLCALSGLLLLVWGRRFFRGVWPAVLFTGFMLPLPFQFERMLSDPLQLLGASQAAWFIQMLGIPAIARGNTIAMGDTQLGVAEACSGLRMLMVFFAIAAAAIIISGRTRWEKLLILCSAVPISLLSNIFRIVATAVAHQYAGRATADLIFHDLSGWLMMPMAIVMLMLELKILDALFVEVADARPGLIVNRIPGSIGMRPS